VFGSSCGFAPSFLIDFFGQFDVAEQTEGDLCVVVHCDALHDLLEQVVVELSGGIVFFKDTVQLLEGVEEFIVLILGELLSSLDSQVGDAVADLRGLLCVVRCSEDTA